MRAIKQITLAFAILLTLGVTGSAHAQTAGQLPLSCFKKEECGSKIAPNSFAVASQECAVLSSEYSYNCISNPPAVQLSVPLGGQNQVQGLQNYIVLIYKVLIGAAGILAGIMITLAGFEWLTARGDSGKIKHAKDRMTKALIGLVLALGSYTILYTINPALVALQLSPIKLIRGTDVPASSIYKDCNVDIDCNPFYIKYAKCSLVTGGSMVGQQVTRICEPTVPAPAVGFKGKCKIAAGGICKISDYVCGSVTNLVSFGLLGTPDSGGADASGFCQKGHSCQPNGDFKPADADLGSPAHQSTCKPTSVGSICKTDNDCPLNSICKLALGPTNMERVDQEQVGICEPKPAQTGRTGEPCIDDRDCASGKCFVNDSIPALNPDRESITLVARGICLQDGGNPIGGDCNRHTECASRLCAQNKCQANDTTAQGENRIREGGLCENNSQCFPGLTCSCTEWNNASMCTGPKKCYPINGEYYPCATDAECGRGYTCQSSGFSPIKMCRSPQ